MGTTEFKLPDIGEGVTEGELVEWLVKPGDQVEVDQPLAEVMTDKATVEIPSPIAGTVKETKANPGDVIEVGDVMLTIEGGATSESAQAEEAQQEPKQESQPEAKPAPAAESKAEPKKPAPANGNGAVHPPVATSQVLATPATRRLAREMNVDINNLKGTGDLGRVLREDVMRASGGGLETVPSATPTMEIPKPRYEGPVGEEEERVPLRGIRRKIAEKMQMAKQVVPHFTIMDEVDVTELVNMRADLKPKAQEMGVKVTYLPFIMKALIATLREFPELNASIDDAAEEIVYKKYFNVGFAADTPQGLLVPVIKHADRKTIMEISREIIDLSTRARAGKLTPDEMKGATISITNIGSIGGTYATPIINHPEVAILGMYKITEKPVIVEGELSSIQSMNISLTADHRLIDGAVAARFIKAISERLQNPGVLMLDLM